VDCLEFRRAAGADPQHLEPGALAHAAGCPRCAAHLRDLLVLDGRLLAALRVPLSSPARSPGGTRSPARIGLDRRRWMALAASIVAGVLVGTLLWVGGPRDSLARDLVAHLGHEPGALADTGRQADPARTEDVLARGRIRLRPEAVTVSYANSCPFRGDVVPHLVVSTAQGPVTVMVLRRERPARPVEFDEQGFAGRIVPAGPGSIAVIGAAGTDLDPIIAEVLAAVEWL